VIEAIDLTVRRRGRAVLEAVSFEVRPGQVTGVLGDAGAGKTTLLRRMVQLDRGGGETLFDGRPYRALAHPMREVGLLLDGVTGYPDHTVRGHLRLVLATDRHAAREPGTREHSRHTERSLVESAAERGAVESAVAGDAFGQAGEGVLAVRDAAGNRIAVRTGVPDDPVVRPKADRRAGPHGSGRPSRRIDAVLDIVGMSGQGRTRLGDLADGMATRLAIAAALLGDPKALLLDCPDRGLTTKGVAWLGDLLRAFTGQGRAALVTCANTETLVSLADRILLLDSGRLVGTRTAQEVLRVPAGSAVVVRSPQILRFAALLSDAGAHSTQGEGASIEVRGLDRARIGDLAYRYGIPLHELAERSTGSDPGDVVLAACSSRGRAVVPIQPVAETVMPVDAVMPEPVVSAEPVVPAGLARSAEAAKTGPHGEPTGPRERAEADA
jgi:ABC-type multidrug transport system ATPase subunit